MASRSRDPEMPRPTDAELEILRALWRLGGGTVREVQADLGRPVGYTTVLKLLQIMLDKGLVTRDESSRSHRYDAAVSRRAAQSQLVGDLVARAFDGSASQLVVRALSEKPVSAEELRQIEELIEGLKENKR